MFINSHIRLNRITVVGVAQLVEPRIVIPVVVGSSPIVHPTFSLILKNKSDKKIGRQKNNN